MATIKISQLPTAASLNDGDILPLVDGTTTKRATLVQIAGYVVATANLSQYATVAALATANAAITALNTSVTTINADVTSIETEIAALQSTSLAKANNLSDVTNTSTALSHLGGLPLAGGTMSGPLVMGTLAAGGNISAVNSLTTTFNPSLTALVFTPTVGFTEYFVATATATPPGNDSNDGSEGAPFLTPGKALTVAVPNDTITLGPGLFALGTGGIELFVNVGLNGINFRGAGSALTTITSTRPLTSGTIIHPGDNIYIGGFTLNGVAASGVFQTPIGSRTLSSQDGFVGVTLNDIVINCGSDGLYIITSELVRMDVYNCVINSTFDCNNLDLIVGSIINFYNCRFTATGPWAGTSSGTARALAVASGNGDYGGRVNCYGCTFTASHGSSVVYAVQNTGCEVWLFNCTLATSNGGTVLDVLTQGVTPGNTYNYNTTGSGVAGAVTANTAPLVISTVANLVDYSSYAKVARAELATVDYLTVNHNITVVGNSNGTGNITAAGQITAGGLNGSLAPDIASGLIGDGSGNLQLYATSLTLNCPLNLNAFALNFDGSSSALADGSGNVTLSSAFWSVYGDITLQNSGKLWVNTNQKLFMNGGNISFQNGSMIDVTTTGQLPIIGANISGSPFNQASPAVWQAVSVNGQTYFVPLYQ